MQKNIVLATAFITMVSYADTLQVPEQYSTIQSAIDASSDGDSISIAAGTYNEALSTDGKAIALFGRDGASSTTIDASGLNGSAIKCMNGEDSGTIIASLTLTGGTGTINPVWETLQGGGIFIYQASPIVVNCVITGNTAEYGGGGAWVQDSTSMFKNVVFENNQVLFDTRGGGGIPLPQGSCTRLGGALARLLMKQIGNKYLPIPKF